MGQRRNYNGNGKTLQLNNYEVNTKCENIKFCRMQRSYAQREILSLNGCIRKKTGKFSGSQEIYLKNLRETKARAKRNELESSNSKMMSSVRNGS